MRVFHTGIAKASGHVQPSESVESLKKRIATFRGLLEGCEARKDGPKCVPVTPRKWTLLYEKMCWMTLDSFVHPSTSAGSQNCRAAEMQHHASRRCCNVLRTVSVSVSVVARLQMDGNARNEDRPHPRFRDLCDHCIWGNARMTSM